ncbi:hypothetical protein [Pantoea sp. A4]|uniref:hypothetical protein n=1 Tax=Pantoea sp. A4 TaxID=1225184 RepID=UPI0008FADAAC|nr:hypothetical protein [Pantoea sp. A4]
MAAFYYVSKQADYADHHVVHAADCRFLPDSNDRQFLGTFYAPNDAIHQAQKYFPSAVGCVTCCPLPLRRHVVEN